MAPIDGTYYCNKCYDLQLNKARINARVNGDAEYISAKKNLAIGSAIGAGHLYFESLEKIHKIESEQISMDDVMSDVSHVRRKAGTTLGKCESRHGRRVLWDLRRD